MKVVFAPDWRRGVPYQRLLAEALARHGVEVNFPQGTRRVLPLYRMMRDLRCDLLHLHWPEAYWSERGQLMDHFRPLRHPIDLQLARLHQPIVYTAHNLWPHNIEPTPPIRTAMQATMRIADLIFVHSSGALEELARTFNVDPARCAVVPHGDLAVDLGTPCAQTEARAALNLHPTRPLALMFGRVEPYKGIEEVIAWWTQHQPEVQLAIVGEIGVRDYDRPLSQLIAGNPNIVWHPNHVTTEELRLWLSAANACVFNYRRIFTSGAASLARSWGLPILLPERLSKLDLGEPSPFVHRFHALEDDFGLALDRALAVAPDYEAARQWREEISWAKIAQRTAQLYQKIILH